MIPSTYVPARNTVFLSLALAWAEVRRRRGAGHRRQRARLLRVPRLPPRIPRGVRAHGHAGHAGRRRRRPLRIPAPLLHLSKADIIRQGPSARSRLRPDPQLLRPAAVTARPAAAATAAGCARAASPQAGVADPLIAGGSALTERLYYHDSALDRVRRPCRRIRCHSPTAAPPSSSIEPPSIRHPAGSRSTPAALGNARVVDVIDQDDGEGSCTCSTRRRARVRPRRRIDWARRFDHMQQHTGQHLLSAAFDSVARRADGQLPPRCRRRRRSIWRARSRRRSSRPRRTKPTASSGTRPACDHPVRRRRARRPRCRCERNPPREGVLRLIEVAGRRPLGLRRHARREHRCDRRHRPRRDRAFQRRIARRVRLRRPGAARRIGGCASLVAAGASALSVAPRRSALGHRAAAGREQGCCAGSSRTSRRAWPCTRRRRSSPAPRGTGDPAFVIAALDGWDAAGLKQIAGAIAAQPGHGAHPPECTCTGSDCGGPGRGHDASTPAPC